MKENVSGCFFLNTVYKCTLNNNTNNKRQREVGPEREGRVVWRGDGRTRVNGSGPDRVEGGMDVLIGLYSYEQNTVGQAANHLHRVKLPMLRIYK